MHNSFKPIIYSGAQHNFELRELLNSNLIDKRDFLDSMLIELALNLNPDLKKQDKDRIQSEIENLKEENIERSHGFWVYYPWRREIIRILGKSDFIFLRTVRNRHKILTEEQDILSKKCVGIVGLSVGYSVLMAIALERIVEKIRIADFDSIELTNLNRIYQPISNLGINKTIAAARAVYELDPYMDIEIYSAGLKNNSSSILEFIKLSSESFIDLIVDECDDGLIKLNLREEARKHRIPVLMETSDRAILDIERYDLEIGYPLLHGMLEPFSGQHDFSEEHSRKILLSSIDFEKASKRGLDSMQQIGKTIRTWPQLGTDVLGGGVSVAIAIKKILLGSAIKSQRIYLDFESRIY